MAERVTPVRPDRSASRRRIYGGRSHAERRADRRTRLLDAAVEQFGTRGYTDATVAVICRAAKVSPRHFYEEFPGRPELLMAAHQQIFDRALGAVRHAHALLPDGTIAERVHAGARAYCEVVAGDSMTARVFFTEVAGAGPVVDDYLKRMLDAAVAAGLAEVQRAARRGEVPRRDPDVAVVAMVGAVHAVIRDWALKGRDPQTLDHTLAEVTDMTVCMLLGGDRR